MEEVTGRAPSGQALVSDGTPADCHPSGFDPSRMSDPWRQMLADACRYAVEQGRGGNWFVSGEYADRIGAQAMQLVADTVGINVIPTGPSDYHEGKTFAPALAMEAAKPTRRETGSARKGDSAGPKDNAQPSGGHGHG